MITPTKTISFEIAGVSFLYKYDSPIKMSSKWPITKFLKVSSTYDVINYITFDRHYEYSWLTDLSPQVTTPSYSIYDFNKQQVVVFTPETSNPVAVLLLNDGFSHVKTIVIDDSYTNQPLPICVTAFLLQGILFENPRGFIMHGAAWTDSTQQIGFIFSGNSGVGKSTISNLFRENGAFLQLSDDRVIITKNGTNYCAHGNPFDFKIARLTNAYSPVKYIFFLHHSATNHISKVPESEKIKRLLTICLLPYWNSSYLIQSAPMINNFSQKVKMYDLYFKPDLDITNYIINFFDNDAID